MEKNVEGMVSACVQILAKAGLTISFAESASAGKLAYEFSRTQYAGQVLKGGVVCYDAGVKVRVLGVPRYVIDEHTPESTEVTRILAVRVRDLLASDVGVGITGLLAPGGSETDEKPVGTVFFCLSSKDRTLEVQKVFRGSPSQIAEALTLEVASYVHRYLCGMDGRVE